MRALIEYLNLDPIGVDRVAGDVSLVMNAEGAVATVVVETDGGATFLPANRVLSYAEEAPMCDFDTTYPHPLNSNPWCPACYVPGAYKGD
jgi:hypothetical protein